MPRVREPARRVPRAGKPVKLPAADLPSRGEVGAVISKVEAALAETVASLKGVKGTGQEQGNEAGGPAVNERRAALSVLLSRYEGTELAGRLFDDGKLPRTVKTDLSWLARAERQPVSRGKKIDFGWSLNPMSTPRALRALAERRAEAAEKAAAAIVADPTRAHDASNDSLLVHLAIEEPPLRAQVLADTLIQLRARRRSEALMDVDLTSEALKGRVEGRFGSSGTVGAFEQRIAARELAPGTSLEARREYALTRLVVANATSGSVNGIFTSRNTIGLLPDYLGPDAYYDAVGAEKGMKTSIFGSIHANYSANTPKAVDYYLRERIFTGGPVESRVEVLRELIRTARAEDPAAVLAELKKSHGYEVPEAKGKTTRAQLEKAIVAHLGKHTEVSDIKTDLGTEGRLKAYEILLAVHRSVVVDRPTAADLKKELFYAGSATGAVAALIHELETGDHLGQVEASGAARAALRKAFFATESAFERQMLWRLDRRVELISAEILGAAVERAESAKDTSGLGECLLAVRSALRGVEASGLEALRARPKTAKTEDLAALRAEADGLLAKGSASAEDIRDLMGRVFRSATEVADTLRGYFHRREGAIRFGGIDVDLDPELSDNLIKESALHYLLGLSQRGMSSGVSSKISADEIRFQSGMRVLSSVGPRVYERILVAKDAASLAKYHPGPNDLCVIGSSSQKDLVYGGGLILDAKHAGPGYSHASVFAKGHGISAIALPGLSEAVKQFFSKAQGSGFYVDDRAESFVIKPLSSAIAEGLLKASEVDALRPGYNLEVSYFGVSADGKRVLEDASSKKISGAHSTRVVELLVPDLSNSLGLSGPATFAELGAAPLDRARQNAGEKGAVLAALTASPKLAALGVTVPGGSVISPWLVKELLSSARVGDQSLFDVWQATLADPSFAIDPSWRLDRLPRMKKAAEKALGALLVARDGKPTKAGRELLAKLEKNPALRGRGAWIARSSFTGEDRPNKSGAGQYSSFPGGVTAKQRLLGIAGVIASAWNTGAVESNLESGIRLEHVWPSVVVQRCLSPAVSGVAVSRGVHGGFGEVSYQAKPKFGGGVDGGKAEEGVLRAGESSVSVKYGDKPLLTPAQQEKLRAAILAVEEEFDARIEPGAQHAVDVEWAFTGDDLHILQARVITGV